MAGEPWNQLMPEDPGYTYGQVLPLRRKNSAGAGAEWAVPGVVRGMINDLALAVTAPGNALAGKYTPDQLMQIAPRMGVTLAGLGLGMPKPSGALGVFGGKLAKTANLAKLAQAKAMELASGEERRAGGVGLSRDDIHAATGWFRDEADQQWKFEIPDDKAKLKGLEPTLADRVNAIHSGDEPAISIPVDSNLKAGDVLEHPDLFAAYPHLADMSIRPGEEGGLAEGQGSFSAQKNTIYFPKATPQNALSVTLHEMQHAIQQREIFATGGNPKEFLPADFQSRLSEAQEDYNKLGDKWRWRGNNPAEFHYAYINDRMGLQAPELYVDAARVKAKYAAINKDAAPARERYLNLAGEVEARNVQARHASGDYELAPWKTQGMEAWPERDREIRWPSKQYQFVPVEDDPFKAKP